MRKGAVVVAAGLSSRMGTFKPLLDIGGECGIRRVLRSLSDGGVQHIVVVTGYRADELKAALRDLDAEFIHNPHFDRSDMWYSARLGLSALVENCDQILFTPGDIPLFSSATVGALLRSSGDWAAPVCRGQTGHPIIISAQLARLLLADEGEGGLRNALERCGAVCRPVPVEDEGILRDMDTPEDYRRILELYRETAP